MSSQRTTGYGLLVVWVDDSGISGDGPGSVRKKETFIGLESHFGGDVSRLRSSPSAPLASLKKPSQKTPKEEAIPFPGLHPTASSLSPHPNRKLPNSLLPSKSPQKRTPYLPLPHSFPPTLVPLHPLPHLPTIDLYSKRYLNRFSHAPILLTNGADIPRYRRQRSQNHWACPCSHSPSYISGSSRGGGTIRAQLRGPNCAVCGFPIDIGEADAWEEEDRDLKSLTVGVLSELGVGAEELCGGCRRSMEGAMDAVSARWPL
ncbi:hypothetical protein BGX38DRAFT_1328544 [Terfezia claveryi]|nr:hypothetical protein BGX38DRAFT_1328544 [Terfezia claveryi]